MNKMGLFAVLLALALFALGCGKTAGEITCDKFEECKSDLFAKTYTAGLSECYDEAANANRSSYELFPNCEDKYRALDDCQVAALEKITCDDFSPVLAELDDCKTEAKDYMECILPKGSSK